MKILLTEGKLSWNANLAISVMWWEINVQVKCANKAITENKCHSIYEDSFFQSKNVLVVVGWRKRKTVNVVPQMKMKLMLWELIVKNQNVMFSHLYKYCESKCIYIYIHTHIYIYTHMCT